MTSRARGCLLAVVGLVAVVAIVSVAVVLSKGVERGTVVELTIGGTIQEERDDSLQGRLFQGDVTTVGEIRAVLDRARRDDHVLGVMAVIKPADAGLGKIEEIRDAVLALRASGKWAIAYLSTAGEFSSGNGAYFLASAFDEVFLSPAGDVNVAGVLFVSPFVRGTLDLLKIYPDFDSIGEFKNAKNLYTEKSFTAAHKQASMEIAHDLYESLVAGIAQGRKKTPEEIRALVDRGPFTGEEALEHGLVDRLAYLDEFRDAAEERAGGKLRTLKWLDYLKRRRSLGQGPHRIAVIHASGIIAQGKSGYDPSVGFIAGSDSITQALRTAREDDSVKAIILRVDSPGGSAVASDVIWRETQLARKEKPVVVSMSDLAASGGYYIACGADRIVAEPSTLTGSIGVVWGKFVTKDFFEWIGLTFDEVQFGKNAGFWSDLKPWSAEEKDALYWKFMHKVYGQFVGHVAEGRKMTREAVNAIGRGHVWTGVRAKELGLVDELGGFAEALRAAKELAKIPEDEGVRYLVLPEKPSLWETLWGEDRESDVDLGPGVRAILARLQPAGRAALLAGEPALLMPFEPIVTVP